MPTDLFDLSIAYAYGIPSARAVLKSENAHFIVDENLGFEPAGDGEHWYLHVQSNGDNTQWVADTIARALGKRPVDVGFCGLKDRNAITRQWFSVYDPKKEAESHLKSLPVELPNSQILNVTRGSAKLRRGMHQSNGFIMTLIFDDVIDKKLMENRLNQIQENGVPNYFGLQRFGREGNNLKSFNTWLLDREQESGARKGRKQRKPKGIILSAVRSQLFNRVLSARVETNTWYLPIEGDVVSNSLPAFPLWGRGRSTTTGEALVYEQEAIAPFNHWANSLEHLGLQQERRVGVCRPEELSWDIIKDNRLKLLFSLPPGQYATCVLREICQTYEPDRRLLEVSIA